MAFSLTNWDKLSAEANTNVRRIYSYLNASDLIATIEAADYFLDVYHLLNVGDWIQVYGSDGYETLVVTASSSSTVTTATLTTVGAGSITNNEINAAAAIAFSKLATLASARLLVGSAGGVPTAVDVTGDVTISNAGVTAIGSGKVLSAMLSQLVLKYAAVTMSAAEFNGAYAAPHLLVAAAGANTLIALEGCYLLMTYGTTQFANGGVAAIQYDSTIHGAGILASTTQAAANFQDAASTALYFNPGVVKNPFATCVNKGLYFSNVTGAFDTGDSTFVAHVWYRVIPTV